MARPDKKLATPDEFELRDDDRPSATGYGYDRRPSRSLAFFGVGMLLVGLVLGYIYYDRHTYRGGDSATTSTVILPK